MQLERQPSQKLRVGYIPYLNCVPFFHYLKQSGFCGTIVPGVPSALNRMLQAGEIDISPSSSFEYLLNNRDYLLLPGLSISSWGPVESVLLFSPSPPGELHDKRIAITGESATSINLLRVLLLEYAGLAKVDDYVPEGSVENLIAQGQPALLIGDRAMRQAANLPEGICCYDLGALWYEFTGLPFVFALWILRRASARRMSEEIAALQDQLERSLRRAFSDLDLLAEKQGAEGAAGRSLVKYWRLIDYSLSEDHLKGLGLFISLCRKHGLLQNEPKIEFCQPV